MFAAARLAMASANNDASQVICKGSRPSFSNFPLFMRGILNLFEPAIFMASFKTLCSVTKILFALCGEYSTNAYMKSENESMSTPFSC